MAAALALFLLAVYGFANAVAVLKIGRYLVGTAGARKGVGRIPYLGDLFYCPPCLAFWIGMAFSVWMMSPASNFCPIWWKAMLIDGFAASGSIWLFHITAERLGHGLDI